MSIFKCTYCVFLSALVGYYLFFAAKNRYFAHKVSRDKLKSNYSEQEGRQAGRHATIPFHSVHSSWINTRPSEWARFELAFGA